tara:strand:- start:4195 stop:4305 length:111 start_codon:yes stop_codon:yes gene_type:complete
VILVLAFFHQRFQAVVHLAQAHAEFFGDFALAWPVS